MHLPPIQLRVVRKESPKEKNYGKRKGYWPNVKKKTFFYSLVLRVYLTNCDDKIYQMTGWRVCAVKLAALIDGAIYKFIGLKVMELKRGNSDIGLVSCREYLPSKKILQFQLQIWLWTARNIIPCLKKR